MQPHPPLLEMHVLLGAVHVNRDVGADRVVGHGQQRYAGLPAVTQDPGHLGQRAAFGQQLRPQHVRCDVPVTQAEPAWAGAVGGELAEHGEALISPAPALLLIDARAERVHDGVQVGRDMQAERGEVVAGVADDGDVSVWDRRAQATQEPGTANAACQNCDAHARSLPSVRRAGVQCCPKGVWATGGSSHAGPRSQENLRGLSPQHGATGWPLSRISLDAMEDTRV